MFLVGKGLRQVTIRYRIQKGLLLSQLTNKYLLDLELLTLKIKFDLQ